jgi:hypothetical protein
VTYLRRYSLMSILGIAAEDDDGEGAVAGPQRATKFTPAVRDPAGDTDLARAAVYRIRREIDDAVYVEELDAKGIHGPVATEDERLIKAQKPNGGAVWEDLVLRDTRKRQQLAEA